jgi:hypothetical protein
MGKPSNPAGLVTEKDILIALVSSIIARHMVTYAVDEPSLHASGHPHADITEELSRRLSLADVSVKQDLLLSQQGVYTAIQESPDYKPWRTATATKLTACLLRDLDGLLSMDLAAQAITERNHILSELYVKGYRIGFRLRMSGNSRYSFTWPVTGATFEPGKMVNERRCLYGDLLTHSGGGYA